MTPIQKQVVKKLIELSYDNGFHSFPLHMVSDLPEKVLFDKNTDSGELYEISQFGKGFIHIKDGSAGVYFELKDQLEHLADNTVGDKV